MITIILVNVDVNQCASMYCVYDMYESIGFCIDVFMNSKIGWTQIDPSHGMMIRHLMTMIW